MIKYQRHPQETTEEQGLRTVKIKFVGITLSISGTRKKSRIESVGGVRYRFYGKPQVLHREL